MRKEHREKREIGEESRVQKWKEKIEEMIRVEGFFLRRCPTEQNRGDRGQKRVKEK